MSYFSDFKKDFLENVLMSSAETYKSRSRTLLIELANNPEPFLPEIITNFESVFTNFLESKPMILLNSLRFLKQIMDLKSPSIGPQIEKSVLPHLVQLARFKQGDKDDDRGRFLFAGSSTKVPEHEAKDQAVIGNSCLRLCLECLLMWRLYYPRSQFDVVAEQLLAEGVKFPTEIYYFKKFESYLKNPQDRSKFENLELHESNDSPDNLFEGYQSESEVLKKVQKGLEEFEFVKREFQKALAASDGRLLHDKGFMKIVERLQEVGKKSFKLQETVMHSNLEAKVSHKYMDLLYENEEYFDEVTEDYKQLLGKQIKEAYFLMKYRGNITNSEDLGVMKSSISNLSEKFKSVEKIKAQVLTKEELLREYAGGRGDSSTLRQRLSNNINNKTNSAKPKDFKESSNRFEKGDGVSAYFGEENKEKGQYFAESEEVPREAYSGKLALKPLNFALKGYSQGEGGDQENSERYPYLEKQMEELKKREKKPSGTLLGKNPIGIMHTVMQGEATINTVNLKEENFPLLPDKLTRLSESGLEERDQISELSQHVPTFGAIFLQSSKLFSEDFSNLNEELLSEHRRLQEKLEILQRRERDIDTRSKGLPPLERRAFLLKGITNRNKDIEILRQKIRGLMRLTEAIEAGEAEPFLSKLQKKQQNLQLENRLLKHLLKQASTTSSTGYTSLNLNPRSSQRPLSTSHSRNPSFRSFKLDNRGSTSNSGPQFHPSNNNNEDFFLKDLQITQNRSENVQRLKICCLRNKAVLFKTNELQVGVLTDLQHYKEKRLWKHYVYIENIDPTVLIQSLVVRFKPGMNLSVWAKSQEEAVATLRPKEQNRKEVIVEHKALPFGFATMDLQYQSMDKVVRNIIALPNFLLKLATFPETDSGELTAIWAKVRQQARRTDEFEVNKSVLEDGLCSLFPYFIEKKQENKGKRQFLCRFGMFGGEGTAKVKLFEERERRLGVVKMVWEAKEGKDPDLGQFLLNSFRFVLEKV